MPPALPEFAAWEICEHRLCPTSSLPLSDRGFRYGQHLFETFPIREGCWHFFPEHLALLLRCAKEAGFPPLPATTLDVLAKLPQRPEFAPWSAALARLYWTAGDGSPTAPPSAGRCFIFLEALPSQTPPRCLQLVEDPDMCLPLGHPSHGAWKTGNYWAALRTLQAARSRGADEALRFHASGNLVGACLGNVFYHRDGQWWTPPLSDGARPGVTRGWLLARDFARESSLHRREAPSITRWLITNSRLGPVAAAWLGQTPAVIEEQDHEIDTLRAMFWTEGKT